MELENSKKIIQGDFDLDQVWKVSFEYYRDYQKEPMSLNEFHKINAELIAVLEKHNMCWKMK